MFINFSFLLLVDIVENSFTSDEMLEYECSSEFYASNTSMILDSLTVVETVFCQRKMCQIGQNRPTSFQNRPHSRQIINDLPAITLALWHRRLTGNKRHMQQHLLYSWRPFTPKSECAQHSRILCCPFSLIQKEPANSTARVLGASSFNACDCVCVCSSRMLSTMTRTSGSRMLQHLYFGPQGDHTEPQSWRWRCTSWWMIGLNG